MTPPSLDSDASQAVEAIKAHSTRFAGLAAVAPQDPATAAREIERAATRLGLRGVIINSHTKGEYLDLPKFRPLLEAAEALGMPIYLHPRDPSPAMVTPYLDYGLYFATGGFSAESGIHALRLSLEVLGVECIMFAVDYPDENDVEAVRFMDVANITENERRQIYAANAERIFKLKA
jgi:predicted TIM-barrel fold metal-dependent hydrolase